MTQILHLVSAAYYTAQPADRDYQPADFAREGFIHCTQTADTLQIVANAYYRQQPGDYVVLIIDLDKVTAPVKFEPPAPLPPPDHPLAQVLFPHVFGALNRNAITGIRPAVRAPDGSFVSV